MNALVSYFEHSLALLFWGLGKETDFFQTVATAELSTYASGILSEAYKFHLLGFEITEWNSITYTGFVCSDTF